ncbi:MAG: D-isomer specific 2-hydroxyacid dehydrogenase family protein [Actinomycetota bacterium]
MSPDGACRIAVVPRARPELVEAVEDGGGEVVSPDVAEAVVWTDPAHPDDLKALLESSPATWVQLPFAGIEGFMEAGVIDEAHTWTCAKGAYGPATAEHALALLLAAARRIHVHARARTWEGEAARHPGERAWRRLSESTIVVVGTGGIGHALASMLRPLGAIVIGVNRSGLPLEGAARTATVDSLPEVVSDADFVVLAAALTAETKGLFGAEMLGRMRPDAWIVNVARGPLIDTDALVAAVEGGALGGAALDVTDPEPLPDGHPLWSLDNVLITPHVANTWAMALPELAAMVRRNVGAFRRGDRLEGMVDPAAGY